MQSKVIGIIGGIGPYAGLDVNKKIYDNTIASQDKHHLDVVCLSFCQNIPDRSEFLLGKTSKNPALYITEKVKTYKLDVIGIACNTFHAPSIFEVFKSEMGISNKRVQIVHLPNEVKKVALRKFNHTTIGVLSSLGTFEANIYQDTFKDVPIHLKFLDKSGRNAIHEALYNEHWGIKYNGKLSQKAKKNIETEINKFENVDAILFACTELPLIIKNIDSSKPIIDPNLILARALIREVDPFKLKE
ncbi:aspartate/glutamate racemase family protein [Bernardetia sp. OM2101]|uniref:aspartate/glutamate racemase family protein n=1 Tax=Bernardetia sp. OM2101 TaxID=3344876 RepID=UPI0035D11A8C